MSRRPVVVWIASSVLLIGCNAIAGILAPKIVSVTVNLPAGLLVGDTAVATAVALGDDHRDHGGRPRKWSSSDPTALSIDANGKMVALAARTVTITAEVDGTKGSATMGIANDDNRFGYALADQPTAAGPYAPDPAYRYNSSGGAVEITRTATGIYSVRFAGLGRAPGQRDNVQVSGYNTTAVYCKPRVWDASGADLLVDVSCFTFNAVATDSRFTILALGARAFGRTTPTAFALVVPDTGTHILDSLATTRNSTGGNVIFGYVSEGAYAMDLKGLESAWAASPVAIQLTPVGQGPRRCSVIAVDPSVAGLGISCTRPGGAVGDSPFSMLWLQRGRPSMRFGFAWTNNENSQADYAPDTHYALNSSGGAISARRTGVGQYRIVFAGLARQPGATEIVLVSPPFLFGPPHICDITSWGNSGANDLAVTVSCFTVSGNPNNTRFDVVVLQ